MTFWKTLFYFYAFSEVGGGAPYRVGNGLWEEFLLVVIPNGIWILLPFLAMAVLWPRIIPAQLPLPVTMNGSCSYEECGSGLKSDSNNNSRNSPRDQHSKQA
jgi:hypothetical protein